MKATLPHLIVSLVGQCNYLNTLKHLLSSHLFTLIASERDREIEGAMALQAPARLKTTTISPLAPTGHVGLRRPSDRLALKSSFFTTSLHLFVSPPQQAISSAAPKFSMRVASKQSYICRDCGYIYSDRTPFEKQPDKYFCPVCGAPKRRFRAYEPTVTKNANDLDVRKARKAQIQRDEAIGRALPIVIGVGVVALAGLYFYLNSAF